MEGWSSTAARREFIFMKKEFIKVRDPSASSIIIWKKVKSKTLKTSLSFSLEMKKFVLHITLVEYPVPCPIMSL